MVSSNKKLLNYMLTQQYGCTHIAVNYCNIVLVINVTTINNLRAIGTLLFL